MPRDFDMRSPSAPRIWPWLNSRRNGSFCSTRPMSRIALVQKRLYSRCITACSAPPVYWSTGVQASTSARVDRARPRRRATGSGTSTTTNRRTCPSCRSRAAPGRRSVGQVVSQERQVVVERVVAAALVVDGLGQAAPAGRRPARARSRRPVAVDDRDRRAPVALAADQPVAQSVGDLGLGLARALASFGDDGLAALVGRHARRTRRC